MLTSRRCRFVTIIRFDVCFSSPSPSPFFINPNLSPPFFLDSTTLVYPPEPTNRFPSLSQPVYVQHFKCNIRDIRSGYPALHRWVRHLYWKVPAFSETTNFAHIKNHYTRSHTQINPLSITPVGPLPDILGLDDEVPAVKAAGKQ